MGIAPISDQKSAAAPSQTNLGGLTSAINTEMQNLNAGPSDFLGSLMGSTSQFDGFLNTIQIFLSAANVPALSADFKTVVSTYNQLDAKFQKNGTVDTKAVNLLMNQWNSLLPNLNKVKITSSQFSTALNNILTNVKNLIPNMMNSQNAAMQAYGEIACLTDATCFYSASMPDHINPPALDNVFEDIQAICFGPTQNRQLAINQLSADLPILQALYPNE